MDVQRGRRAGDVEVGGGERADGGLGLRALVGR
jgi:hypothetical protein